MFICVFTHFPAKQTGIKFQSCFLKFDNHRAFFSQYTQTKFRAMNKGYLLKVFQAQRNRLKVGWGIIYPSHGFNRVTVTDYLTQCQICIGYPLTSQSDPNTLTETADLGSIPLF